VTIARRGSTLTFPAEAQLVAASNPCPCGFRGDRLRSCRCSSSSLERYGKRLSGPFLDRFDLRIQVPTVEPLALLGEQAEDSATVHRRVLAARAVQAARGQRNGRLDRADLDQHQVDPAGQDLIAKAMAVGMLTARGVDRVRRVARTIADLGGEEAVAEEHVAEAIAFRVDL
jgi:magnesium chelatase family protein